MTETANGSPAYTGPDMNDPRYVASMAEMKAQQRKKYIDNLESNRMYFVRTVEEAAASNPTIDIAIYKKIVDVNNNMHQQLVADLLKAHDNSPPNMLQYNLNAVRSQYAAKLRDRTYAAFPDRRDEVTAALASVTEEMQPESIFSAPGKFVYDSKNGGMQWAGLAGGLAMGFVGFKLTSGAGTLLNILGTVALGAAGTYFAHKYIDKKPEPRVVPDLHSPAKGPQMALQRQRDVGDENQVGTVAIGKKDDRIPEERPDFATIMARADQASPPMPGDADAKSMGLRGVTVKPLPGMDIA